MMCNFCQYFHSRKISSTPLTESGTNTNKGGMWQPVVTCFQTFDECLHPCVAEVLWYTIPRIFFKCSLEANAFSASVDNGFLFVDALFSSIITTSKRALTTWLHDSIAFTYFPYWCTHQIIFLKNKHIGLSLSAFTISNI